MNSAADLYRVQIKHLSNNLLNQGTLLPCVKYWKCISHQRYHLPTVFKGKDKVDGTDSFTKKGTHITQLAVWSTSDADFYTSGFTLLTFTAGFVFASRFVAQLKYSFLNKM